MVWSHKILTVCASMLLVAGLQNISLGAVNWQPTGGPGISLTFENADNWDTSDYETPPPTPELTPPGSDSVWFVTNYDGVITSTAPRTEATTKLGPGRLGGGDADQHTIWIIDTDLTITGQERDGTGAVRTDNLREFRLGGDDTTPNDDLYPLVEVIQRSGHFNLEYADNPVEGDLKLISDKNITSGAVWEVGGTAQFSASGRIMVADKDGVVSPGATFRVRGSDVIGVSAADRLLATSRAAYWDLEEIDYGDYSAQKVNRGKSIVEFVLDQGGVTPIELGGNLTLGSEYVDIDTLGVFVVPGFLRIKIAEPTMAGSGGIGSGNEQVLIRADNIDSRITNFEGSQSQDGVFFDPDRDQSGFPHRVISRDGTGQVISQYAGVTYTWDAVYDDNSLGLEMIEDAVVLTNLVISDPGGSGIHGDFDDANGLDANDANALQTAFGTEIGFQDAQHMFDLNADGQIDKSDLLQLITHPGFANSNIGDFDLDSDTDDADLEILEGNFGTTTGALFTDGDSDLDGDVDGADVLNWMRNVTGGGSLSAVPEPGGMMLALMAGLALTGRRQRR